MGARKFAMASAWRAVERKWLNQEHSSSSAAQFEDEGRPEVGTFATARSRAWHKHKKRRRESSLFVLQRCAATGKLLGQVNVPVGPDAGVAGIYSAVWPLPVPLEPLRFALALPERLDVAIGVKPVHRA